MTWIDLGDPHPKDRPNSYRPFIWPLGNSEMLPMPATDSAVNYFEVLHRRRSARLFGALTQDQLSTFLWHTNSRAALAQSHYGFDLERRPSPSAGAIHPVHTLLKQPTSSRWCLYRPQNHSFSEILDSDNRLRPVSEKRQYLVEDQNATEILFVAEPGKTTAKYENACSLVWRDAGVLMGVMSLTAEALGLHFCLLGMTGEPWVSALAEQGQLIGVGSALLGSIP